MTATRAHTSDVGGRWIRLGCAVALVVLVCSIGAGPADASGLGLPDSTGASGAYHFTSDGALGPASPGVSIVGGIAVINATTFVVDTGVTVSLTGPYPFDIRATGNVVIDGLLDAGAQGAVPGPGGFAGGSPGLGDGPGGAQQGADVVAGRGGCGGAGGSAYAGAGSHPGTAGEPGATCTQPGYVDAGGGGGAAGAGVEALLHGWGGVRRRRRRGYLGHGHPRAWRCRRGQRSDQLGDERDHRLCRCGRSQRIGRGRRLSQRFRRWRRWRRRRRIGDP